MEKQQIMKLQNYGNLRQGTRKSSERNYTVYNKSQLPILGIYRKHVNNSSWLDNFVQPYVQNDNISDYYCHLG